MPRKRTDLNIDDLVKAYTDGEGIESISKRCHCGWSWLAKQFMYRGIKLRNRNAAMLTRWSMLDQVGRDALLAAAHLAATGRVPSREEVMTRMKSRAITQYKNKIFAATSEQSMLKWLKRRGIKGEWQLAVDSYNIDIAIGTVAVEIHRAANHPLTDRRCRKRTIQLIERGWSVIYVWENLSHPLRVVAADEIVTFVDFVKAHPTTTGHYRVIWGTGERAPAPQSHHDYMTTIPTAV